ncbi:MAG TPA: glycine cleavage system protein GcvH [Acholeplasmataceae bacterium]|nr:glycine cleavage system protein GcvH [Acholeplasmataceae bacterium]
MSKVLDNLSYTKTHEWVKVENDIALVGITDYAQDSLGSIVYLELGSVGDNVNQFDEIGTIESVKAAGEINAPVSGEIVEVNEDVVDNPEKINENPYENWLLKIKLSDENELKNLLRAEEYKSEIE